MQRKWGRMSDAIDYLFDEIEHHAVLRSHATLVRDARVAITQLRAELDEWENAKKFVADGCTDEIHCGCVPILKREMDAQTKAVEEARKILDAGQTYFDYLKGRVMKIDLSRDEVDTQLYNRDNGPGAAERALERFMDEITRPNRG